MFISEVLTDDLVLADGTVVRLDGHQLPHLEALQAALAAYDETEDPAAIELGLRAARALLGALPPPDAELSRRPHLDELRRLSDALPEFGELLTVAADQADRAVAAGCERLWTALGLRGPAPRWTTAEHETARMVFACACGPSPGAAGDGPEWLQAGLRRIAATRLAELIGADLTHSEAVWRSVLGDRYDSLRHRCAPRTKLRSRGLAELLADDVDCRRAVIARLERWVAAGGHPHALAAEIEAAVVHARTPSRLA